MGHTLLCGQRRYTMPTVIVPDRGIIVTKAAAQYTFTALQITNIKPPMGLVLSGRHTDAGNSPLARFVTEKGTVVLAVPPMPTLFLYDGVIREAAYGADTTKELDYFQWWLVQDTQYLVEVAAAYGR